MSVPKSERSVRQFERRRRERAAYYARSLRNRGLQIQAGLFGELVIFNLRGGSRVREIRLAMRVVESLEPEIGEWVRAKEVQSEH